MKDFVENFKVRWRLNWVYAFFWAIFNYHFLDLNLGFVIGSFYIAMTTIGNYIFFCGFDVIFEKLFKKTKK